MNAVQDTEWSRGWRSWGRRLPRPKAILAISAHWWTDGIHATAQQTPPTIHDFGGFPPELHAVNYSAPGSPSLAARIAELVEGALPTEEWGLDHGTWSVLVHLFPGADIPVVQLSLDARTDPAGHIHLGKTLAPLREEGVLLVASGNVTHNLGAFFRAMSRSAGGNEWAPRFESSVREALLGRDEKTLAALEKSPEGRLAHPTPDHWRPLLVAYGATDSSDHTSFPVEGLDGGCLSMLSVEWSGESSPA